ncbi:phosphatase PAP2 family protein [Rhizobium daejeonense]|nr:phosphatase PAP2 family protein [Rhizobium daejeonense]
MNALYDAIVHDRRARRWTILALAMVFLWFLLLVLFHFLPQIDIAVSRAFFVPATCPEANPTRVCGGFTYGRDALYAFLRKALFYAPAIGAVALVIALLNALRNPRSPDSTRRIKNYAVSLITLLLGPYVLVNLILKQVSERPRPYETDLFAGPLPFVPAGSFAGQCEDNCSFISGEAAGAGWLVCLIFLLPDRLRPVLGPAIIVVSFVTSAFRVAFGGHYLSDVLLGWLSTLVLFTAVFAVFEIARSRKNQP